MNRNPSVTQATALEPIDTTMGGLVGWLASSSSSLECVFAFHFTVKQSKSQTAFTTCFWILYCYLFFLFGPSIGLD